MTRRGVELIRAGRWSVSTGTWDAKPEHLAQAVEALDCPAIRLPVLKLGHVDSRFNGDGQPALGWVQNLRVTDGGHTLVGDFQGMPAWLDGILASAYPDRSVEAQYGFRCGLGHTHPFVLTGVALLGETPPGVGTLKSIRDVPALYGLAASGQPGGTPITILIKAKRKETAVRETIPAGMDPVDWALQTDRITEETARWVWRDMARDDPASARTILAAMSPGAESRTGGGQEQRPPTSTFRPPAGREAEFALNPLIGALKQHKPAIYQAALTTGSPPTLFESGDLPVYTASGIDPQQLLRVPWYGRHAVAAAASPAEAADLIETLSGEGGAYVAAAYGHSRHAETQLYEQRVLDFELRGLDVLGQRREKAEVRRVAASTGQAKSFEDMTDEERYESLYGHSDRVAAAARDAEERAILEGRSVGHYRDPNQIRAAREIRAKRGQL